MNTVRTRFGLIIFSQVHRFFPGKSKGGQAKPGVMHLSENEGIEGSNFVVTGGLGFVGAALCKELVRRGAREVRSFDLRPTSTWSSDLLSIGVRCFQGLQFPPFPDLCFFNLHIWLVIHRWVNLTHWFDFFFHTKKLDLFTLNPAIEIINYSLIAYCFWSFRSIGIQSSIVVLRVWSCTELLTFCLRCLSLPSCIKFSHLSSNACKTPFSWLSLEAQHLRLPFHQPNGKCL